MNYKSYYSTPEGFTDIVLKSDGEVLTGLYFLGTKGSEKQQVNCEEKDLEIFRETCRWLDVYFSGRQPDFTPAYRIESLTPFREDVIEGMLKIPFGSTATYGDLAKQIALKRGKARMSAQAVGGAVGWNPLCILVPCHRVVGSNGSLTGYGGGVGNKIALLKLEGHDMEQYSMCEDKWSVKTED